MVKGRKVRELPEEVRERVVIEHGQCKGYKRISKELNVPVSTVVNIIKKFKIHGTVANVPGRGRKCKIDARMKKKMVRMVVKDPKQTSKQIQANIKAQGVTVSSRTIRRCLNENGFRCKATKDPDPKK